MSRRTVPAAPPGYIWRVHSIEVDGHRKRVLRCVPASGNRIGLVVENSSAIVGGLAAYGNLAVVRPIRAGLDAIARSPIGNGYIYGYQKVMYAHDHRPVMERYQAADEKFVTEQLRAKGVSDKEILDLDREQRAFMLAEFEHPAPYMDHESFNIPEPTEDIEIDDVPVQAPETEAVLSKS